MRVVHPLTVPPFVMQVMLSHHNIIAQCMQLKQLQAPDPDRYKILAVMPLFHSKS